MKQKLLSLALTLALCLGLTTIPASAAKNPYTDDWGTRFSDVLEKKTETFTGYTGRKVTQTIYYLEPESTIRVGKQAQTIGYYQISRNETTLLDRTYSIRSTEIEKTYTRDEFEKQFGAYDMYCLVTQPERQNGKTPDPEYLYFLFDDSAAANAADYVISGTTLERYRGAGGAMTIPDGVVRIQGMFMDASTAANISTLSIPATVREIDSWSFSNCTELSNVTLPSSLRTLGDCAFTGCTRLSSVIIPGSLTEVGSAVFADCGLTRVTFQSGLTEIGPSMFSGCQKLVAVTIPASVTKVGSRAFAGCTMLNSVIFENGNTQIEADAIPQNSNILGLIIQGPQLTVSAPAGGSVEAYCKARNINFRATGTVPGGTTTPTVPTVTVENIPASGTAFASTQTVTVDGKAVEFQMYALKDANGNLTNYIKLRDMAYVLNGTKAQFAVGFDGTISLSTGQAYAAGGTEMTTPFSGNRSYTGGAQGVKVNGSSVDMTAITLTDDAGGAYNYFKLRDLGKVLGFHVGYSNEAGVSIDSTKPYTE